MRVFYTVLDYWRKKFWLLISKCNLVYYRVQKEKSTIFFWKYRQKFLKISKKLLTNIIWPLDFILVIWFQNNWPIRLYLYDDCQTKFSLE